MSAATVSGTASPRVARGTRVRAGNAMAGTRHRLLGAVGQILAERGSRLTMVDVATTAGVAKATLYNHFRTKEEVFAAFAEAELARIFAAATEADDLATALVRAAGQISAHPVLAHLRDVEPEVLATLAAAIGVARPLVESLLREFRADPRAAELVLRWVASMILAPSEPAQALETAAFLCLTLGQ